jgi:MFS transporter, FSR family, fosmidomycin resistance protein
LTRLTSDESVTSRAGVVLLTFSHVANDFYQGAVPAIIPFLVVVYHYNYLAVTGITLAATFISSVAQPAFGVLTDRHRLTWLPIVGMLVAAAGVALAGVAPTYALVWLAIALSGAGIAAYHPEAARAARLAAGTSAQGMSWFALGGNLGFALAPITITPILLRTGLHGTLLLFVPAAVAAVVVGRLLRRLVPNAPPAETGGAAEEQRDDWPSFLWLTLVVICRSILFFGMASFLALYLIKHFHQSTQVGATALTVFTLAGAVSTIAGGWLADRFGRVPTIRLGYALALPGVAGLVLAPNPGVVFAAAVLCGVGIYIPFSVQITLGQEYLPNRIGTASGVTLGLAVSAGGIFAPLFGVLADAHGLGAALAALGALPVVALLASTRLPETHRTLRSARTPDHARS